MGVNGSFFCSSVKLEEKCDVTPESCRLVCEEEEVPRRLKEMQEKLPPTQTGRAEDTTK